MQASPSDEVLGEERRAVLAAVLARLIPTDESGPGAEEACVIDYVTRALSGESRELRPTYESGLDGIDARAHAGYGERFASLASADQDALLVSIERDNGDGGLRSFLELLREHAIQGFFGDPHHGGNAGFVGWDLIGFPGVKLTIPEHDQRLDVIVEPAHKSTTDYPVFAISARRFGSG